MQTVAEGACASPYFHDAGWDLRTGLELGGDPSGVPENGINHAQILSAPNRTRVVWTQVI